MGRTKYAQKEFDTIRKLLKRKCEGNRFQQKQIRHILRTEYEFNISDFGTQGQAFGPVELDAALQRGAIQILDDATIEAMKAKRARDKAQDQANAQNTSTQTYDPNADWKKALEEWDNYTNITPNK